jgi:hypothetical protein
MHPWAGIQELRTQGVRIMRHTLVFLKGRRVFIQYARLWLNDKLLVKYMSGTEYTVRLAGLPLRRLSQPRSFV